MVKYLLFLIPLIVRFNSIVISEPFGNLGFGNLDNDVFSFNKMIIYIILSIIIFLIFIFKEKNIKFIKHEKSNLYIVLLLLTSILSTVFSVYRYSSIKGSPTRYENVVVIICYISSLLIIKNYQFDAKYYKNNIKLLFYSSLIISIIGISQIIGKDFWSTQLGKFIMIPHIYIENIGEITFTMGEGRAYGTVYNPNYLGVYMGMIIPLSTTLLILRKDIKEKIFYAIVTILALINILGAGSKAGLLSIIFYLILLLIFFRKKIFKNSGKNLAVVLIFIITIFGFNAYKDNHIKKIMVNAFKSFEKQPESDFKDFKLGNNEMTIVKDDFTLKMDYDDGSIIFMDENDDEIEYEVDGSKIYFEDEVYKGTTFIYSDFGEFLGFEINLPTNKGDRKFLVGLDDENHFRFINRVGELMYESAEAESFGFKGREKLASGRGYIWSRSIPLLKKSLIIGSGADTYALVFPQDDIIGRAKTGFNPTVIVDKPHNMYLQTAINTGVISLIALLLIYGYYIVDSFKIYFNKDEYNTYLEMAGISIFFAIMSYLFLGLSNDSVISVAPVFWVLLGMGYSINNILKQEVG